MSGYSRSSYPPPAAPMSRQQEKNELQHLNERFGDYIKKVEDAKKQANQVDSSALLNAIKNLENEIGVIKNLYEKELEKLRRENEAVTAERQAHEAASKKHAAVASELQQRLNTEQQHNRALQDEIAKLRQLLANKDQALNQAAAANNDLARKLDNAKKENDALKRNYDDVHGKFDKDNKALANAQEALANLQKKSDFERKLRDEEIAELKSRLDDKGRQILQLEARLRESAQKESNLPEMLARVRNAAADELDKYKKESQAEYAKNLNDLKNQMGKDAENVAKLAEENKKLAAALEDAKRENNALRNKIQALENDNSRLAELLAQERQKSNVHIRALEDKIKDLQDKLVAKLQQEGSNREPPIRAEIESLKVLVEDAENKVARPSATPNNATYGTMRTPPTYTGGNSGKYMNTTGLSTSLTSPSGRPERDYYSTLVNDTNKRERESSSLFPRISDKTIYRTSYGYK